VATAERLFREHAAALLAFLRARTGDAALAEDLLADTFERALRARARPAPGADGERPWLYAIALNRLRDVARRRAAEDRALALAMAGAALADAVSGAPTDDERTDALRRALTLLTPAEHEAVALRFGEDLSVPAVARRLGQPTTAVEARLARALRKLRSAL